MDKPLLALLSRQAMLALVAAISMLLVGIVLNGLVQLYDIRPTLRGAFERGQIESGPPPNLSPWWLQTRAQSDCTQLQPLVTGNSDWAETAVLRRYLRDPLRLARPCELLGEHISRGESARVSAVVGRTGLASASVLISPLLALMGVAGTRWLHLALLLAGATLIFLAELRRRPTDFRPAALVASFAVLAVVFGVPGSITLLPVTIVILAMLALVSLWPDPLWWARHGTAVGPWLAGALIMLDPSAASTCVGLGLLIYALALRRSDGGAERIALPAAGYVLTILLFWLGYAVIAGLVGEGKGAETLARSLADYPATPWLHDLYLGLGRTASWLAQGPIAGEAKLLILVWSVPFAIALHAFHQDSEGQGNPRMRSFAALLAMAPVFVWILLYPGYFRRGVQDYVLLWVWLAAVAAVGPVALMLNGISALRSSRRATAVNPSSSPLGA